MTRMQHQGEPVRLSGTDSSTASVAALECGDSSSLLHFGVSTPFISPPLPNPHPPRRSVLRLVCQEWGRGDNRSEINARWVACLWWVPHASPERGDVSGTIPPHPGLGCNIVTRSPGFRPVLSEDRPAGTEQDTCNTLTWRGPPPSFDPAHRNASDTSILPHSCRRSSHYPTEDRQHSHLPTCVVRRAVSARGQSQRKRSPTGGTTLWSTAKTRLTQTNR
jgi:hypothetical protein